jgi:hypothetical protein
MQDVGHQLAVEVRAGLVEKPLQHRRIDGNGVVIPAEELQWLQVLCASLEQLEVVAVSVGNGRPNARARLDDLGE